MDIKIIVEKINYCINGELFYLKEYYYSVQWSLGGSYYCILEYPF